MTIFRCKYGHTERRPRAATVRGPVCFVCRNQMFAFAEDRPTVRQEHADMPNSFDRHIPLRPDTEPAPAPHCLMLGPWAPPVFSRRPGARRY